MINKFSCHNFRNIQAEDLEFEKINILIGPNNSGKSNFIKALTFFSEMLRTGKDNLMIITTPDNTDGKSNLNPKLYFTKLSDLNFQ